VIVPDPQRPPTGRVVVGVNGSKTSHEALRWAAGAVRLRQDRLTVAHAWQLTPCRSRDVLRPARAVPAQRAAAERLHGWVHSVPGAIDAELMTAHGAPLDALLRASTEADLLVLGHHTRPGPARLLGSAVSSGCHGDHEDSGDGKGGAVEAVGDALPVGAEGVARDAPRPSSRGCSRASCARRAGRAA
jgi:nucleotide-binding universal stress UspA family protein